ncbi:3946_t:CDS:10 [Gigaspora margarita]|uniref:3946_t:CDS:1 n=1 Tax=Gigaspora margarita TaxID=4874 RepID=A0ABN7VD19_GIGMA|nr:3946_t:CDS:10 [Gigaspora margarita]
MLCKCGKNANHYETKKEGPNKGRWFYSCPLRKCGFFLWDGPSTSNTSGQSVKSAPRPPRPQKTTNFSSYSTTSNNSTNLSAETPSSSSRILPDWGKQTVQPNNAQKIKQLVPQQDKVDIYFSIFDKNKFIVRGYHQKLVLLWKEMPNSLFNVSERGWVMPLSQYQNCMQKLRNVKDVKMNIHEFPPYIVKLFCGIDDIEAKRNEAVREIHERIPSELWDTLMNFQKEGVTQAVIRNGRILLGDEMGLGKTIQALTICKFYESEWPVLIICPSSLRLTWCSEIQKWLGVRESHIQVIFHLKDKINRPTPKFLITSYDCAAKIGCDFADKFNIVITDEAHYLKNKDTKRSKSICPLIQNATRALLLTGTPALSKPIELFSLANSLDKTTFSTFTQYGIRYCNASRGAYGWDYSGSSNLEELHWLLERTILIRRLKADVELELPPKTRQIVHIEIRTMKKESEELYRIVQRSSGQMKKDAEMKGKALLVQMWAETGRSKVPAIQEYLSEIYENSEKKFIVFGHHLEVLDAITDYFSAKLNAKLIRIDGNTNPHHRQALCDQFQEDKKTRIAVLSLTAASTGLTLHAADLVIFAELFWNPSTLLQAEDRAHRIGRRGSVDIKYMLAKDTSDTIQWQLVRSKLRVVGKMLDNDFGKVTMDEGTSFGAAAPDILSWFVQADESNNLPLDDNIEVPQNVIDVDKPIPKLHDYTEILDIDKSNQQLQDNNTEVSQDEIDIIDIDESIPKLQDDAEYDESIWQCWDQKDYSTHWLKYTNFGIMPPDYVISDPGYKEYISQFSKPSSSVVSPCTMFSRRDNSDNNNDNKDLNLTSRPSLKRGLEEAFHSPLSKKPKHE